MKCQCAGCGKFFSRDSIFEMHRVGTYYPLTRRCLTTEEMAAIGLASERKMVKGELNGKLHQTEQDIWYSVEARELARLAFAGR